MRKQLSKATAIGLVLAAVAAGTMFVPAATAQSSTTKKKGTSAASAKSGASSHGSASHTASAITKSTASKSGKTSGKKSAKTKKVKGQAAPAPERINEIQDALARHGALVGGNSGKFDDSTSDALKKFQAANHLNPTGKVDALTLQKLGLGSETAGLAAPTPPPNSVANRLLSRNQRSDPNDDN